MNEVMTTQDAADAVLLLDTLALPADVRNRVTIHLTDFIVKAKAGETGIAGHRVDMRVVHLMVDQGGSFVHHLGRAWLCADPANSFHMSMVHSGIYLQYAARLAVLEGTRSEVSA